jgi:hypothetical protein
MPCPIWYFKFKSDNSKFLIKLICINMLTNFLVEVVGLNELRFSKHCDFVKLLFSLNV